MKELKFARITKKSKTFSKEVYDLKVEDDSSYNIKDLIVHNSGASSLVAYLLGIHRINPLDLRWGHMPFERFLAPGRLSNKILIFDEDGNKKEFISQDTVRVVRDGEELDIEAKFLEEGDDFIEVIERFSA